MEELNCGHLVWYVYDEFTSLSTFFLLVIHGTVFGIGSRDLVMDGAWAI
jgi:hypothetical protein